MRTPLLSHVRFVPAATLAFGLAAALCFQCTSENSSSGTPGQGGQDGQAGHAGSGNHDAGKPLEPSGYLLLPAEQFQRVKNDVTNGSPAWVALKKNVDDEMATRDIYRTSVENIALVYLLTGEQKYADAAFAWLEELMDEDVRFDSYLLFGDHMRQAALVLNYCSGGLSDTQRQTITTYLDQWTNELWFDNQGSGWGLDDSGNNYHMAFLEGTAFAGVALKQAAHPNADKYLGILNDKLTKTSGVLDYLNTRAKGGDWPEGTNYGLRSKQRLLSALSALASSGGPVYFRTSPFFEELIRFSFYQIQPGDEWLYPAGDASRDAELPLSPYEREVVQTAGFWVSDPTARGLARWFSEQVVPAYVGPYRGLLYKDLLYFNDATPVARDTLPLHFHAEGTHWVNLRTGWDAQAMSLSIAGGSIVDQSHTHFDAGSFTIFHRGWQAVDAVTFSDSGLNWSSGAHNTLHVPGHENRGGVVPGLLQYEHTDDFTYVQVDASRLHLHRPGSDVVPMMQEYTRELIALPPNSLVLYDRATPTAAAKNYHLRFHFASSPTATDGAYRAVRDGGSITVKVLEGGATSVHSNGDLSDGSSESWRIEVAALSSPTRYLSTVQTANGAGASNGWVKLKTEGGIAATSDEKYVVVFSAADRGKPASLPFSYVVPDAAARIHLLCNLSDGVSISSQNEGAGRKYTVTAGSDHVPSKSGVVTARP